MKEIKERIKEALDIRNMTASDLAKKSKINKGAISKYINGLVIPKQSAIGEMSKALSVSPAWLMGYEVDMDPQAETEKSVLLSEEQEFISKYRHLDATDKVKVESYTDGLLSQEKYTAPRSSEGVS